LARRLATWTIDEKKISNSQKGFLPFEGCLEHSFLLQSVFEDSKRRKRNARVVWLDLKNAFGSVPHHTMWEMMERLDIPAHFQSVCKEIYSHSTQNFRCKEGFTNEIPVSRGDAHSALSYSTWCLKESSLNWKRQEAISSQMAQWCEYLPTLMTFAS